MSTLSKFKLGASSALIVAICIFGAILFTALKEYDGTPMETFGFGIAILCAGVGIATLLFSLYGVLKWKPL